MALITTCILAYLLGSVPFGYLASRFAGVDVRRHGSGNIGATNVLRVLGRKYGYTVFLADTLKGFLAVRTAFWLDGHRAASWQLAVLAAICAVLGHAFPVWLGFRGGKGVATSAGACLGLLPLETAVAVAVWLSVFAVFRLVSLASIIAAVSLPVSVWLMAPGQGRTREMLVAFTAALAALVTLRHRSNIRRLLNGTEPRFESK
ncbi:MAG: acyl-phosphate glycerol 3-phosphate acyltransferase [Chthoniobacterales bacterium]|nr:MAG: acyl-phosphate glycerol 3-phosphate acyltransferase [Chthoniobacterales bacterium]